MNWYHSDMSTTANFYATSKLLVVVFFSLSFFDIFMLIRNIEMFIFFLSSTLPCPPFLCLPLSFWIWISYVPGWPQITLCTWGWTQILIVLPQSPESWDYRHKTTMPNLYYFGNGIQGFMLAEQICLSTEHLPCQWFLLSTYPPKAFEEDNFQWVFLFLLLFGFFKAGSC